jgi:nucleotide-binding universal stress UspA family protein
LRDAESSEQTAGWSGIMKILLAMDDSRFSQAALESVETQVNPKKTEVLVLHVLELMPYYLTPEMAPRHPAVLESLLAAVRSAAETLVASAVERLQQAGFQASSSIQEGDPKSLIVDTASEWHADLIVLGSHGRKGLERFLIGSVSDAVARHAPCSVEIVRPREKKK